MDSDIQTPEMSHTTVLFVLQIICYLGAVFFCFHSLSVCCVDGFLAVPHHAHRVVLCGAEVLSE